MLSIKNKVLRKTIKSSHIDTIFPLSEKSERHIPQSLHYRPSRLREGVGWGVSGARDLSTKTKPKAKYNKNVKIRRGGFFPLRSAVRNISHREAIYRIRRIYRAEGISCALRARGEGAKTSREGRFYSFRAACGTQSARSTWGFRPLRKSARATRP